MRLVLLPRAGGPAACAEVPRAFVTHITNAFDDGDDGTVVHFIGATGLAEAAALNVGAWRLRVGARDGAVARRTDALQGEFPATHPRAHGRPHAVHYYAGCSRRGKTMDAWVKVCARTGERTLAVTPGALHMEAVFVPRAGAGSAEVRGGGARFAPAYNNIIASRGQDDGYLVGFVLVGGAVFVKVVCARTMRTQCVVHTPDLNVTGLHACWVDNELFDAA